MLLSSHAAQLFVRGAVALVAVSALSSADAGGRSALFSFGNKPCGDAGCDTGCTEVPCVQQPACEAPACVPAARPEPACAVPERRLVLQPGCDAPCVDGCDADGCGGLGCGRGGCGRAGCAACRDRAPLFKRHSDAWYAAHAHLPPGERQHMHKGKPWLVEPRPCGIPEQPFWHKYHTNKTWPHPYNCVDRSAVRTTMCAHVDRGWMNMTTLHAHHFNEQTHELNGAGRRQLMQILHDVPREYRTAYVAAYDRPTADARMASVKAQIMDMAGPAEQVAVLPRATMAYGRPATEVDFIHRSALQSMPAPVIGSAGGGAAGGGGGGGTTQQ